MRAGAGCLEACTQDVLCKLWEVNEHIWEALCPWSQVLRCLTFKELLLSTYCMLGAGGCKVIGDWWGLRDWLRKADP